MKIARALLGSLSLLTLAHPLWSVDAQDAPAPFAEPPEPADKPAGKPAQAPDRTAEIDALTQELAAVMDELVQARARAGVIARGLFQTELAVDVVRRADAQRLTHVSLKLDGVQVHDSDGSALGKDRATLFTGYVAPGMHELAIELVENAKENASYGYTRTERYRIEVKKGHSTQVELVLRDDSDMAEEAAEGDHGEYQLETTLRVSSRKVTSAGSSRVRD